MIKSSVEKLAEDIGYDIGSSDDETQGKLLNGFCEALANSMDEHRLEGQLCFIVKKLKPKSHKVIKELAEFIKLKEKES